MPLLPIFATLLALGAQTPAAASAPRPLMLVLDVEADHLAAADRDGLGEAINLALARRLDLEVQSAKALQARAQLGAEQQAAGCDTSACLAEIANAMGARYVAFTRVVRLGAEQLLRIDIFDNDTGNTVAFASRQGDLPSLFVGVDPLVDTLLKSAPGLPVRAGVGRGVDVVGIVVGSVGVVAAVVGTVIAVTGGSAATALNDASATWQTAPSAANANAVRAARIAAGDGATSSVLVVGGVALAAVGVTAAIVGITMIADGAP